MSSGNEVVAYEMEVKGSLSSEWSTHYFSAEEVPDNPKEMWKSNQQVRNVRPLVYGDEIDE